ncbi:MAG: hypothetical protein QME94_14200 [Anaerolineae bacterium]|nr:hypothetical protein [Anaerolineae bacterium]
MTHLWTVGPEIAVQSEDEPGPASFIWAGRLHRVATFCNSWRVHTGWWQQEVWRDYYKVQTEDGLLCVIYHDLLKGCWHLASIYD